MRAGDRWVCDVEVACGMHAAVMRAGGSCRSHRSCGSLSLARALRLWVQMNHDEIAEAEAFDAEMNEDEQGDDEPVRAQSSPIG